MNKPTSKAAIALLLVAGVLASASAQTTDWPTRAVTMVVPFPPGGPVDIIGRIAADALRNQLKTTVTVENGQGANGAVAVNTIKQAPAD